MITSIEVVNFFRENPAYAGLFLLILILAMYQEHIKTLMTHPEKKDKKRNPKLSVAHADKATGIIFGKKGKKCYYSDAFQEGHVFVCAASGAGKTTAIAIPMYPILLQSNQQKKGILPKHKKTIPVSSSTYPVILNQTVTFQINWSGI